MSLFVAEYLIGCLTIADTFYLGDECYIRSTLPFVPLSLSIMVLTWVVPLVFFSFASPWILGTTTCIKFQGSLSTVGTWMIMPQEVQALNGFSPPRPCSKNSLKLVSWFSHIIVTLQNVSPNHPTKLRVFSLASPSPMAFPPSGPPSHPCFGPRTCAYVLAHAVSYFIPHFFLFPPISHAVNILTFSHSSILHRVNVSVKPFSSLTFLFLPLTSPYSILPLGGVRLSLRPPPC